MAVQALQLETRRRMTELTVTQLGVSPTWAYARHTPNYSKLAYEADRRAETFFFLNGVDAKAARRSATVPSMRLPRPTQRWTLFTSGIGGSEKTHARKRIAHRPSILLDTI
jgi:hypothetical protein